jgi:hypothetical protein
MEIISCQLRQPEATQKVIRETTSGIRKVFIKICDIYLEKRRSMGCVNRRHMPCVLLIS